MKTSGIYQIQSNIKPERCYIGSSENITKRWVEHSNALKCGIHYNKKLQYHVNKYGFADLIFTLLIGCDISNLILNEQFFIDSYNPYFNICKKAGSKLGIPHTLATRIKMSNSGKIKIFTKSHRDHLSIAGSKRSHVRTEKEILKRKTNGTNMSYVNSESFKQKCRKPKTELHRKHISEGRKGRKYKKLKNTA